ncbi:hypothetical protein Ssi03_77100 [Sphaerisporangium siamense]|uniref:Uncharacterized protein n=1 Tax=Sphaerisporangium siamense TaxID=795645 RepID=A0A7W7D8M9_9ACTN|nr:hypothetical protein [Sphaerisporangium siamense]MBB4702272.1 hypothetical protein [Sphaerisporangium siamense]GII89720.1 hypothetical protein Ssi03_77100 [Sphaerisporangium siamense]
MRFRSLVSTAALAAGLLVAPVAVGAADATTAAAACQYKRVGNHWNCITPGAYCPAAAHGKLGISKTGNRYRCTRYSNGRWRWKRA